MPPHELSATATLSKVLDRIKGWLIWGIVINGLLLAVSVLTIALLLKYGGHL